MSQSDRHRPHGRATLGALAATAAALLASASPGAAGGDASPRRFPVFVWRLDHDGQALPEPLVEPFGGTNVEGADEAAWARERGLEFYVGRAAGWGELHLRRERPWYDALWRRWFEERDAALLVRQPCLTDPTTRTALSAHLRATFGAREGHHGRFALLGDEIGLTPWGDPFDLCTSPTCRAAWRAYVAETPAGWDDAFGQRLPETDAVRVAFGDGRTDELGAWLARRRFHQDVVLGLVRSLAAEARELAPATPLGLSGLVGRTAFGGVAFEELVDTLDVLEPYPVSDARELAFTLRDDEEVLTTVFAHGLELAGEDAAGNEEAVAAAAAWQVWEHWLRGGDGAVLWSDRELARSQALRERLARTVADVRALDAALGGWRPRPSGLAVLHDGDSIALAWLRDALLDGPTWPRRFQGYQEQHGTRERDLRAWLRLAEDSGLLPGALPVARVDAATAQRFPVLVANHLAVLGQADVARLERYLAAGGTLLVTGPFAEFDRRGVARAADLFGRLRERFPERVQPSPADVASYLTARVDARPRAYELRRWLRQRTDAAGIGSPPFTLRAGTTLPWLIARVDDEAGTTYALLPNAQDNEARGGRLRELRVTVEAHDEREAAWLHPRPDAAGSVTLAAGQAAVLRLSR